MPRPQKFNCTQGLRDAICRSVTAGFREGGFFRARRTCPGRYWMHERHSSICSDFGGTIPGHQLIARTATTSTGRSRREISGEKEHSILQQALVFLFRLNRDTWSVEVFPELRIQVKPTRYRVPDITVVPTGVSWERILRKAALLFIEILSPEDRLSKVRERVDDYLSLGTEHVWIVDPELRKG